MSVFIYYSIIENLNVSSKFQANHNEMNSLTNEKLSNCRDCIDYGEIESQKQREKMK